MLVVGTDKGGLTECGREKPPSGCLFSMCWSPRWDVHLRETHMETIRIRMQL